MAEDLEITGATAGSPRYIVAYLDVNTNNLYDANGQLYGNNTLAAYLDNEFILELHYVQDISTSSNPEEWAVWDGLKDLTVSSTLAFDDNYLHAVRGTIVADASAGDESISVDVTDEINKDTLSRYGVLLVNPFGDEEDQLMIPYSSFQQISGTTFSFIVDDAQGLEASVSKDSPVRVSDPLYMFINVNDIYEANIPNRYEEGVFKFPVNVMSRKLLNALDYSGSTGVSGTMEHKIYTNKNTITGITVTGSTTVLKRDIDDDEVAGVHIVGVKTTIGGDTVHPRDASHDTTNDGTDYYAWMNTENDTVAFYTKTTNVTVGTLLYDEMYYTQLDETVSALVDIVNPYLFCAWTNGAAVSPTVFWTKGNEVDSGDSVYTILGGTANVVSGTTASPNIATELVLFRTFAFPFIVRNLVDYGISLTIPVEDIDWTKEYVISIIRNNMEEVTGKASKGAYGVVLIGTNIDVADGVISVKDASTSDKGIIQIATGDEVTAGSDSSKAVVPSTLKTELDKKQNNLTFDTTTGIEVINGSTVKNDIATVEEVVKGTAGSNLVDADGLTGALSMGKAVDVTSDPHADIGTLTYTNDDIRDTITYTGVAGTAKIGFYEGATFPKYAPNCWYMLVADITNNSSSAISDITFGGTSLNDFDGTIAKNATKRIAFKFNTANTGYITFTSTSGTSLTIKKLREFEVNGCSEEARKYIGKLSNPDKHEDFYLVDYDEVNPWTKYIDMQTSPAVTLMSGLAYKLNAKTGTHTLTTDVCPSEYYGEDAHLKLYVGDTANIVFKSPLNLIDPLTPNAGHNITVKFRDGQANAYVDDTDIGYVVAVTAGTEGGSFYDFFTNKRGEYVVFSSTTDNVPIEIINANASQIFTTPSRVCSIIGNGIDKTDIQSGGDGTNWLYFYWGTISIQNLSMSLGFTWACNSLTIRNVRFHNIHAIRGGISSNYPHGFNIGGYLRPPIMTDCIVEGCTAKQDNYLGHIAGVSYNYSGDEVALVKNVVFRNNVSGIPLSVGKPTFIENCEFSGNNNTTYSLYVEDRAYNTTVKNCIFRDDIQYSIRVYQNMNAILKMDGTNIVTKPIYCSSVMLNKFLLPDSILDVSEFSSNDPVCNTGIISGSTNSQGEVVFGTSYVIPYGGGEPVAIYGSGKTLRSNGKLGYEVSVATGTTASNTLYDALVGGGTAYSNVVFDPALDGQTVSYPETTSGVFELETRTNCMIDGNGIGNTIIAGPTLTRVLPSDTTAGNFTIKNLTVTAGHISTKNQSRSTHVTAENVLFKGISGVTGIFGAANGVGYPGYFLVTGCTISDCSCTGPGTQNIYSHSGTYNGYTMRNCLVVDSSETNTEYAMVVINYDHLVTGSTFSNVTRAVSNTNTGGGTIEDCLFVNCPTFAVRDKKTADNNSKLTITGCTFGTGANIVQTESTSNILFSGTNILNSTVSGDGTVEFTDGATVTSTIPSGSTIGTGVICTTISPNPAGTCTIKNVTLSGYTGSIMGEHTTGNALKRMYFNNVEIKNNTAPSSTFLVSILTTQQWICNNLRVYKDTMTNMAAFYVTTGDFIGTNCYIDHNMTCNSGHIVFVGENSVRSVAKSSDTNTASTLILSPDSVTTLTKDSSLYSYLRSANIVVGTFNVDTRTYVTGGTATIIANGSTVHVTGTGSYFELDGSTDLTIVE